MAKKSPFPKELIVTEERPKNDEPFLVTYKTDDDFFDSNHFDGTPYARYTLVEVGTLHVKKTVDMLIHPRSKKGKK